MYGRIGSEIERKPDYRYPIIKYPIYFRLTFYNRTQPFRVTKPCTKCSSIHTVK